MSGLEISQGSKPFNGSFLPQDSFERLYGEKPVGTWTLIPIDNSFYDPLCVSGFSITVRTRSGSDQTVPNYTWFSSETMNTVLAVGSKYSPLITQESGSQSFWVSARNPGYCDSDKVEAEVRVREVPLVFATSLTELIGTDASFLYPVAGIRYVETPEPTVSIQKSGQEYSYSLRGVKVQQDIVTICKPDIYIVASVGCMGTTRWSNGFVGEAQLMQISENTSWQITCERDWGICKVPEPKTLTASVGQNSDIRITTTIEAGVSQTYLGNKVTLSSQIGTPSEIRVLAKKSVTFEPGFQVTASSNFVAKIGECGN
jgi:hypothetical protein